jgi:hypothetical protein
MGSLLAGYIGYSTYYMLQEKSLKQVKSIRDLKVGDTVHVEGKCRLRELNHNSASYDS